MKIKVQFIWKWRNVARKNVTVDQHKIVEFKVECKTNGENIEVDDDFYTRLVCGDEDVIIQYIDEHFRNEQVDSAMWDIIDAYVELLSDVDTRTAKVENTQDNESQYTISVPLLDCEGNGTIYIPVGKLCVIYEDTCHTIESIFVLKESLLPTIVDAYFNRILTDKDAMLLPEEIYIRYSEQSGQKWGVSCKKQNKNYYIRRKV